MVNPPSTRTVTARNSSIWMLTSASSSSTTELSHPQTFPSGAITLVYCDWHSYLLCARCRSQRIMTRFALHCSTLWLQASSAQATVAMPRRCIHFSLYVRRGDRAASSRSQGLPRCPRVYPRHLSKTRFAPRRVGYTERRRRNTSSKSGRCSKAEGTAAMYLDLEVLHSLQN